MTEPITFGRPFVLRRDRDISDVSGTGIIADGILFPDGHAAIHWRGRWPLTTPHPDGIESIIAIHDHGGRGDLHIVWADERAECGKFVLRWGDHTLGPCVREPGHPEVFHRDANGTEWRPTRPAPALTVHLDNSEATFTPRPEMREVEDEPEHDWRYPTPSSGLVCRRCRLAHKFWSGESCIDVDSGIQDTQACPYCTGGPQFPRQQLGAHVQSTHARVLAALARGVSLDELLHDPETRCRLPHEMEG